jgi:hypothetical protein
MIAVDEKNRMDERFMMLDQLFMKVSNSAMNIGNYKDSNEMYSKMDKNAQSFSPNDILKGFENAMNMTPEMLKSSGASDEQIKQMTQGIAKMKKELSGNKMSEFKEALSKIKKEDLVKANEGIKAIGKSAPKTSDIIKEYESLVPYAKLPSKLGDCEEMEEQ